MDDLRTAVRARTAARRARRNALGPTQILRLTGHLGQVERERYLEALGAATRAGTCTAAEAIAELHELSESWMRALVRTRLRRLPPHADPQTTEHWLWLEWHGALSRFDPARVDSFPAYVALRLRMAVAAAAREDDPLPRKARTRLREFERAESALMQDLGRPLTGAEQSRLADSILGVWRPVIRARLGIGELPTDDLVSAEPDPATAVERSSLRGAVRAALSTDREPRRRGLLLWLQEADRHDRLPSTRVARVSPPVRAALAAWVGEAPDSSPAA